MPTRLSVEEAACRFDVRWVAKLRHCAGLDLTDALSTEVELFTDLPEGAGLAPVETETQREDQSFPLVKRAEQRGDFEWQSREDRGVAGRQLRVVFDDITELGNRVVAEWLGQRQRSEARPASPRES